MSCQIKQLINQGRDQSFPLSDGEMEARHWWRRCFSSSSSSSDSSFIVRGKQKALPVVNHRVFKDFVFFFLSASTQPEVFLQPPAERMTGFTLQDLLKLLFTVLNMCTKKNTSEAKSVYFKATRRCENEIKYNS